VFYSQINSILYKFDQFLKLFKCFMFKCNALCVPSECELNFENNNETSTQIFNKVP